MTSTVLFDLDGTLLDTEMDFTPILNELLLQHGKLAVHSEFIRKHVSNGARAMICAGFGIDETHEKHPSLLQQMLSTYEERIHQSKAELFKGIASLIRSLEDKSIIWGIVTNKPGRFTHPLLKYFPELKNSAIVVCADDLENSKPDPEGILLACKQLGVSPEKVFYVGDHPKDVEAASRAGAKSIAVRWGYLPEEPAIENWHADAIVSTPQEILDFL